MGDFAEDAIYSNYYRGEEDDSRENTSGAFDHEERAFLDAEHNKQMNELNRRMVEEFDKSLRPASPSDATTRKGN